MALEPDPFFPHPDGPWHETHFDETVEGIRSLLMRYAAGQVSEHHLLKGKDNGRVKRDTLSYWLYFQHHLGHERWKILGQRYWSVQAYASFRDRFCATPEAKRHSSDGGASLATIPKRRADGDQGLLSEHVVPKKVMKRLLLDPPGSIADLLRLNICAVVTLSEDRRLVRAGHIDPFNPWVRYAGTGIRFIENPSWTNAERADLARYDLIA